MWTRFKLFFFNAVKKTIVDFLWEKWKRANWYFIFQNWKLSNFVLLFFGFNWKTPRSHGYTLIQIKNGLGFVDLFYKMFFLLWLNSFGWTATVFYKTRLTFCPFHLNWHNSFSLLLISCFQALPCSLHSSLPSIRHFFSSLYHSMKGHDTLVVRNFFSFLPVYTVQIYLIHLSPHSEFVATIIIWFVYFLNEIWNISAVKHNQEL